MKKIMPLMFLVLTALSGYCHAYDPPIGTPQPPSVLMDADVDDYIGEYYTFNDGRGTIQYPISSSGHPYTHYIDQDDPYATDTDNPYGTEAVPRLTIPFQSSKYPTDTSLYLAEGSVMEIHGSEYDFPYANVSVYCDGSSDNPVFIRGADSDNKAILANDNIYICGQYAVFENLQYNETFNWFQHLNYSTLNNAPCYMIVRNCTATGDGLPEVYNAFDTYSNDSDHKVNHIVFYNNTISYYGQWDYGSENDSHAFSIRYYSHYIWVLDNHAHHLGGDSVQIGNNSDRKTQYVYVGGNDFHHNRENAVDIKQAEDVIVSHNDMHDYGIPADEAGMTVHEGSVSGNTCPKDIWIIFNKFYDSDYGGITFQYGVNVNLIGNLFYNIPTSVPDAGYSKAIVINGIEGGETHNYINNTFYNCEQLIWKLGDVDTFSSLLIANNIFDTLSEGTAGYWQNHLRIQADASNVTVEYNLFYQDGGTEKIRWEETDYSLSAFQSATGNGQNCIADNPDFITPGSNFYLQADSPAIDSAKTDGSIAAIYADFESQYGISILYDIEGNPLPGSGSRSMGAYQGEGSSTKYILFMEGE